MSSDALPRPRPAGRAGDLVTLLGLQPHPEGGWYREIHRAAATVDPLDGRPRRSALTTIDFLLADGQCSAWHRVASDEVWHLLEGGPLQLWLAPPDLGAVQVVELAAAGPATRPRAVVPAGWWQAAVPAGGFAYVGATVGPGFDFADFAFLRDRPGAAEALARLHPQAPRWL